MGEEPAGLLLDLPSVPLTSEASRTASHPMQPCQPLPAQRWGPTAAVLLLMSCPPSPLICALTQDAVPGIPERRGRGPHPARDPEAHSERGLCQAGPGLLFG